MITYQLTKKGSPVRAAPDWGSIPHVEEQVEEEGASEKLRKDKRRGGRIKQGAFPKLKEAKS